MNRSLVSLTLLGLLALLLLTFSAAESCGRWIHFALRAQIYAGGTAGIALGLAGLPFTTKLAVIATQAKEAESELWYWRWWGLGFLTRLALLLALAIALTIYFPQPAAALLAMS